ncbi:MAG: hypothetical protein R6U94_05085 [Nitriliruptoraceae bacterium]
MRTTTLRVANARFDRVALALVGAVVLASATWSAFLIDSVLSWLPVVPHTLIWLIGTFLVLRTEHRFIGWPLAASGVFVTGFVSVLDPAVPVLPGTAAHLPASPAGRAEAAQVVRVRAHGDPDVPAARVARLVG